MLLSMELVNLEIQGMIIGLENQDGLQQLQLIVWMLLGRM